MGSANTTSDADVRLQEPPLLTLQQTAHMLGLSRRWVEQAVADGRIPVVRVGPQAPRIRRAALDEWLGPWSPVATLLTDYPRRRRRRVSASDPHGRIPEEAA